MISDLSMTARCSNAALCLMLAFMFFVLAVNLRTALSESGDWPRVEVMCIMLIWGMAVLCCGLFLFGSLLVCFVA